MSGIYSGGAPYAGSFAYASLPSAATYSGYEAFVTDWGPNGAKARSNGARWLPIGGRLLLVHLGAAVNSIANVNTIVLQALIPAGAWQANDSLYIDYSLSKSGTTDSLNAALYIGTAGTTSDTGIFSGNGFLAAANRVVSSTFVLKLASSTSVQKTLVGSQFGSPTNSAIPAPVTISSAASNALYVSLAIQSTSTNDTVGIQDGAIWQIVN